MGELRIVAGVWGRRRLKSPRRGALRPTSERVREAWMSVLGPALAGARVLDLFAGTGALGLEALSRGAVAVTFVEREARALRCLRANIAALEAADTTSVVAADAFAFVEKLNASVFDIALADPPYGEGLADRLVQRYVRDPFAGQLSVEFEFGEQPRLPPNTVSRRYGDTMIAFIHAADLEEQA